MLFILYLFIHYLFFFITICLFMVSITVGRPTRGTTCYIKVCVINNTTTSHPNTKLSFKILFLLKNASLIIVSIKHEQQNIKILKFVLFTQFILKKLSIQLSGPEDAIF